MMCIFSGHEMTESYNCFDGYASDYCRRLDWNLDKLELNLLEQVSREEQ